MEPREGVRKGGRGYNTIRRRVGAAEKIWGRKCGGTLLSGVLMTAAAPAAFWKWQLFDGGRGQKVKGKRGLKGMAMSDAAPGEMKEMEGEGKTSGGEQSEGRQQIQRPGSST